MIKFHAFAPSKKCYEQLFRGASKSQQTSGCQAVQATKYFDQYLNKSDFSKKEEALREERGRFFEQHSARVFGSDTKNHEPSGAEPSMVDTLPLCNVRGPRKSCFKGMYVSRRKNGFFLPFFC